MTPDPTPAASEAVLLPLFPEIQRILDEYGAWIAGPRPEVSKAVANAALNAAVEVLSRITPPPTAPADLAARLVALRAKATTGLMTVERCDDSVDGAIQYEVYREHGRIAVLHADEVGGRAKGTANLIAFMLSNIDELIAASAAGADVRAFEAGAEAGT